ncbi:MAG: hypothetical protein COB59_12035 [Rhodospirillaceae bacterium]|nr:MAG: hypothetical protein COB59_12035 [Rhodospirillaceae bacterium]
MKISLRKFMVTIGSVFGTFIVSPALSKLFSPASIVIQTLAIAEKDVALSVPRLRTLLFSLTPMGNSSELRKHPIPTDSSLGLNDALFA